MATKRQNENVQYALFCFLLTKNHQPFTADMVLRALNTRNVLIPERFATPGARVM